MSKRKTLAELNAEVQARFKARKLVVPESIKTMAWSYAKAKAVAEFAGITLGADAEEIWEQQKTEHQSQRKLQWIDEMGTTRESDISMIMSGSVRLTLPTEEEKQERRAKTARTITDRDLGQRSHMEASSIVGLMKILDPENTLKYLPLPDGLGADFVIVRSTPHECLYSKCPVEIGGPYGPRKSVPLCSLGARRRQLSHIYRYRYQRRR